MGNWGTAISSNDTYADVYATFFDLHNEGLDVKAISDKLISDSGDILNDASDVNNFWFALAKAQWECKQLDATLFAKVKTIIEDGLDLVVWQDLGADEKQVKKRKVALKNFIDGLSQEKAEARPRKKPSILKPAFIKGDCIVFKLHNGNFGAAVVLEEFFNTKYALNLIAVTAINQRLEPTIDEVIKSNLLIKNFAVHNNSPSINWFYPVNYKKAAHLFELIGNIKIERTFDPDPHQTEYSFGGDFEISIIEVSNRQFEHEQLTGKKPKQITSIRSLIKKSEWKLW